MINGFTHIKSRKNWIKYKIMQYFYVIKNKNCSKS